MECLHTAVEDALNMPACAHVYIKDCMHNKHKFHGGNIVLIRQTTLQFGCKPHAEVKHP